MEPDLERLAKKYVWWETPVRALERRDLFLCQLMQLGTWDDVRTARRALGDQAFREGLQNAPPGILDERSWNFWNRFYGMVPVRSLPQRPLL